VPKLQVDGAQCLDVLRQIGENDFDANGNWRFAVLTQVASIAKIEFFNRGSAIQTVWPKYEIKRFTNCALADIVATDQERMARELKFGFLDAAKVLYLQP
jgi:hypothetical protein